VSAVNFRFYLISDRRILPIEEIPALFNRLIPHVPEGITAFQLREKDLPGLMLYASAMQIRKVLSSGKIPLFINDRLDIARSLQMDGIHLGRNSIPHSVVRKNYNGLVGISCHSLEESVLAQKCGADFISFGPVFKTPSKSRYGKPRGIGELNKVCKKLSIPVFAIGGIDLSNAFMLKNTGIHGISCIRAVLQSRRPEETMMKMLFQAGLK
jgi:thiamine-phosphate pyrophosphorylase